MHTFFHKAEDTVITGQLDADCRVTDENPETGEKIFLKCWTVTISDTVSERCVMFRLNIKEMQCLITLIFSVDSDIEGDPAEGAVQAMMDHCYAVMDPIIEPLQESHGMGVRPYP